MKEKCMVCGSVVDDIAGICPVCGAALTRSSQIDPDGEMNYNPNGSVPSGNMPNNNMPNGNVPNGNVPNGNVPYGNMPNNPYGNMSNNPYGNAPQNNQPKKFAFSIISMICSILALIVSCCVPGLGMVLAIVALVFAVLALIKKHVKGLAITGLIVGVLALLISSVGLLFTVAFKSTIGTNVPGLFSQLFEAQSVGCYEIEDVVMLSPQDYEYYVFYTNGTYDTANSGSGTYECYNFMSYNQLYPSDIEAEYALFYAMNQGYKVKNMTILRINNVNQYYIVPDDFAPGDMIYYINTDGASYTDYTSVPVLTETIQY